MDDDLYKSVRQARLWYTEGLISMEAFDTILTDYERQLNREQHRFSKAELSPFHPNMRENR